MGWDDSPKKDCVTETASRKTPPIGPLVRPEQQTTTKTARDCRDRDVREKAPLDYWTTGENQVACQDAAWMLSRCVVVHYCKTSIPEFWPFLNAMLQSNLDERFPMTPVACAV